MNSAKRFGKLADNANNPKRTTIPISIFDRPRTTGECKQKGKRNVRTPKSNSQSSLHAAQALMNTQSGIEVTQNTMKHCENIKAKKKREFETKTDEYSAMWRNFGCEGISIRKSMVLLYAHRRYG